MILKRCVWRRFYATQAKGEREIIFEVFQNVGVATLNRPKQMNAFNKSMCVDLFSKINEWKDDARVGLILIKNLNKGDAFSVGGDIKAVRELIVARDLKRAVLPFKASYSLGYAIASCKKPVIAVLDGVTMGGGVSLSLGAKFSVATERTVFGIPETSVGFYPDIGLSHFLSKHGVPLGLYLVLTGGRLVGKEMYDTGLATNFVHSSKVSALINDLKSLHKPTETQIEWTLKQHSSDSRSEYQHLERINSIFNADSVEQIIEKLEGDKSEWAKKHLEMMRRLCPLSVKVAFEQFKYAPKLTLKQTVKIDYGITHRFVENDNFSEGIRAILIDKDNAPKWNPPRIEDVTRESVKRMFEQTSYDDVIQL